MQAIKIVDLGLTRNSYKNVKYLENGNIVATWTKPSTHENDMALTKSYYQVFDPHGKAITSPITLLYIYTPKLETLKTQFWIR